MVHRMQLSPSSARTVENPLPQASRDGKTTMTSFVNSVLSPFVQCVAPPVHACVNPVGTTSSSSPFSTKGAVAGQGQQIFRTPRRGGYASPMAVTPETLHETQPGTTSTASFGENDVLCGKGRSSICHTGNRRFRELVEANKGEYARGTRKQKTMLAHSIVDLIHNAQPPGRFVLRDMETGQWYDIGRSRSFERTSQALREKSNSVVCGTVQSSSSYKPFGRPSLIIPEHLRSVFGPPPALSTPPAHHQGGTEYRNPPHSLDGPQHAQQMYIYPIPSASSFEIMSSCSSTPSSEASLGGLFVSRTRTSSPSQMVVSPLPSQGRVPVSPPQAMHPAFSHAGGSVTEPLPPTELSCSPSFVARQDSLPFDTSVDTGCYRSEHTLVAPSCVRRSRRQDSGEDGQAALSAAAFLKLDDIE